MCELLGTEPDPSEFPVSREDLAIETQEVFHLYDILPAKWEGFSGSYLGKDLTLLPILFEQFEFNKAMILYSWNIIPIIDNFIAEDIAKKIKSKSKSKEDVIRG